MSYDEPAAEEFAPEAEEPVFAYRTSKDGKVFISWHGRTVTTLAGPAAQRFLARVAAGDDAAAQLEMARVTGNFKRGNERVGKLRDRNA